MQQPEQVHREILLIVNFSMEEEHGELVSFTISTRFMKRRIPLITLENLGYNIFATIGAHDVFNNYFDFGNLN